MSPLPKLNFGLICIAVLAYLLMLSGPITNSFLTDNYITQTKVLLTTNSTISFILPSNNWFLYFINFLYLLSNNYEERIYDIEGYMQNIMQINYLCLILKIRPSSKSITLALYLNKALDLNNQIPNLKDDISNIILDEQNLS